MKVFVPASSSSDSSYLLYKILTETSDQVVTRMFHSDASKEDLVKQRQVCEWLKKNVRDFDYKFGEIEIDPETHGIPRFDAQRYLIASHANFHKADLIYIGYNLYNWSETNWFFQTTQPIEEFYTNDENLKYYIHKYSVFRKTTNIPVRWPYLTRGEKPFGRWQIYEKLPNELKPLISTGCNECGKCMKCYCKKWYLEKKSEGFTAQDIDDLIMKEGRYGKYWTPESKPSQRHSAYFNIK